jgi:hypothetical protein
MNSYRRESANVHPSAFLIPRRIMGVELWFPIPAKVSVFQALPATEPIGNDALFHDDPPSLDSNMLPNVHAPELVQP